jgi:hypothetical protein
MAGLDTNTLKQDLLDLTKEMRKMKKIDDEYYAEKLSEIMEKFVKSAKITVQPGQSVQVSASGTGATTGTGSAIIS